MSHKNRKYAHAMIQHEISGRPPEKTTNHQSELPGRSLSRTFTNNLGLIATIGAGCAAATFLITTRMGRELGRRVGTKTRDMVTNGAGRISEMITERGNQAYEFLRSKFPTPLSREEILAQREFDEKIRQLQEHFKQPAA